MRNRSNQRRSSRRLRLLLVLTLCLAPPAASALAQDAYVANYLSGTLSVIDTKTNRVVGSISVGEGPHAVAISPNGKIAYVINEFFGRNGDYWSRVRLIETQTGRVVGSNRVGVKPNAIALSPDGKTAYVVNCSSNNVSVIDTKSNQVVGAPIKVGGFPQAIAIAPDGKAAYVANFLSGAISVIDTETNRWWVRSASARNRARSQSAPTAQPPTSPTTAQTPSR